MEFQKIPFVKLTLLLIVLAVIIYLYGIVKVDIFHNPDIEKAIDEVIPYLYTAIALGCISIFTFVFAIIQRLVNNKQSQ